MAKNALRLMAGRILLALLVPLALLSLLEGALRLFHIGARPAPFVLDSEATEPTFQTNPNYDADAFPGRNAVSDADQKFRAEKGPRGKRIFFLGASTVFGAGYYPHSTPPMWLKQRLQTVLPDYDVEVINCGIPGADSRAIARIAQDIVPYEPDLVVLYTGHNELLWPNIYAISHPWSWTFRELCTDMHLLRIMVSTLRSEPTIQFEDPTSGKEGPVFVDPFVSDEVHQKALTLYQDHLGEIKETFRDADIPWVLCVPASCLANVSPVQSAFSQAWTEAQRHQMNQDLIRAAELIETEAIDQAREILNGVLDQDHRIALAHFLVGKCHYAQNRLSQAKSSLLTAWELDRYPNRAGPSFVDAVRGFARKNRVPCADIFEAFAQEVPEFLPGEELFIDHCHPTLEGQSLITEVIVEVIRTQTDVFPQADWKMALDKSRESYLEDFDMDPAQLAQTFHQKCLANLRSWLVTTRATREELQRALSSAQKALQWAPDNPRYQGVLGLVKAFRGDVESGARQLLEAQQKDATALKDLAGLMARSPRLLKQINSWGIKIEDDAFLPRQGP